MKIDLRGVLAAEAIKIREAIAASDGKTTLALPGVRLSDAGTIALANALRSSSYTTLDLDSTDITDVGVAALANTLPHSNVTKLDLSCTAITDVGVEALATALPALKLTGINLFCTGITDAGARHLLAAIPRSRAPSLALCGTRVHWRLQMAINGALNDCRHRNKLFLLLRLMVFFRFDGDNAMLHRIAGFLMR